jgi:hypothetical protein
VRFFWTVRLDFQAHLLRAAFDSELRLLALPGDANRKLLRAAQRRAEECQDGG